MLLEAGGGGVKLHRGEKERQVCRQPSEGGRIVFLDCLDVNHTPSDSAKRQYKYIDRDLSKQVVCIDRDLPYIDRDLQVY